MIPMTGEDDGMGGVPFVPLSLRERVGVRT
jgi:hypothetical protein